MVGTEGFSIPLVLVQQELAHLAGRYWMLESNQIPFDIQNVTDPEQRITTLNRMILGVELTDTELDDWIQYVDLLEGEFSAEEVWASIATVMMQDPRFWCINDDTTQSIQTCCSRGSSRIEYASNRFWKFRYAAQLIWVTCFGGWDATRALIPAFLIRLW